MAPGMFELIFVLSAIALVVVGGIVVFRKFAGTPTKAIAPIRASSTVSFLSLGSTEHSDLVQADKRSVGDLFREIPYLGGKFPIADVVFCYCSFKQDGTIEGIDLSLKDLIARTEAKVLIVATESSVETYVEASKAPGKGRANQVLTVNRDGVNFGIFFRELFLKMRKGIPMPLAWVQLAPQGPVQTKISAPETICVMELGHVVLEAA